MKKMIVDQNTAEIMRRNLIGLGIYITPEGKLRMPLSSIGYYLRYIAKGEVA
jgi:hypothetical protein